MKRVLKYFLLVFMTAMFLMVPKAHASEGVVELQGTSDQNSRCFILSTFMDDQQYHLLGACRDITYPANGNFLTYVLWATPPDKDRPFKLGSLGFGKISLMTRLSFVNLFVTKEPNANVRDPSGLIVMRGEVKPIGFLTGPVPTKTPESEEITTTPTEPETYQPEQATLPGRSIVDFFRESMVAPIVGLLGIILFILLLIRRKE